MAPFAGYPLPAACRTTALGALREVEGMIWQLIDSSGVGGAERHVATLSQSLVRRSLPVTVVLYGDHGPNAWLRQLDEARLTYRILGNSMASLRAALKQDAPALVHTHGYKTGIFGRLAARAAGVPVVSTFHSGSRGAGQVYVYDILDEWTSFLGGRIVVSETIKQRLPYSSVLAPSYILTPSAPQTGKLPPVVGFAGRLSAEKGPDIFCEIAARGPEGVSWRVYGDGPMRQELEARYGAIVDFRGTVTDMAKVWREIGLLMMPSRSEGLPLAALEALSEGVPVLASRVGGLPNLVIDGRTGWLFEAGHVDQAIAKIANWRSLDLQAANAMRTQCWSHVRDNYSEARYLPPVLDVYQAAGVAV